MPPTVIEPKPGVDMGRVIVQVEVENYDDWRDRNDNGSGSGLARRLTCEALVDTGATLLCLPVGLVRQLGLVPFETRLARTAAGMVDRTIYRPAVLRVQGRDCIVPVGELPEESTPLLGQIPLELMDWWVDVANRRLVGNPEHGGEWQHEM